MSKLKKSSIFILITIFYAILIFYLSITSKLGELKHLLIKDLGYGAMDVLIENNLAFVKDFLFETLRFIIETSIDPAHLIIYFIFGILLYFAFSNFNSPEMAKHPAVYAIGIGTVYGIVNEIFQMYLPFRVASMADVISNFVGLTVAQIFVLIFILGLKKLKFREIQL